MSTFSEQISKNRITTTYQDVLNQPTSTCQLWDTYGLTEDQLVSRNLWDINQRIMQTNDIVHVRYHDAYTDDICGNFDMLMGYARHLGGDEYVSQLFKLLPGQDYCTLEVRDIQALAGPGTYHLKMHDNGTLSAVYIFVDSKTLAGGKVKLYSSSDSVLGTVTLDNGATYGSMYSITSGFDASPATSYKIVVTKGANEKSHANLHIVGIVNLS